MEGMELPPEIAKFLIDKIKDRIEQQKEEESRYVSVAALKPDDVIRRVTYDSEMSAIRGRMKVLIAKLEALEAEKSAKHSEWWEYLYATYNLPRECHYQMEENTIKKKPRKSCDCGNCK